MDLRDRLQSTLGNAYSVERELGGGGMSRVFLARETALGRNVVVKLLSSDAVVGLSAERFAREVRLAASLQHPNIVPVLTTGIADGVPYYTMPYVKGESLRARMKEQPPLSRNQIVSLLKDVARALDYAHGERVIHRDIKPENVLLSGGSAVVTDFGIAKAISAARTDADVLDETGGSSLTMAGAAVGTPAYMAPEQAAGDKLDHRVDIYAWGVMAYELLAGAHPFAGKTSAAQVIAAHISQIPAPIADRAPGISTTLADLVTRCLAKEPQRRPPSAAEILETLDSDHDVPASRGVRKPRRYTAAGALLVVVALLAAAAYVYSTKHSSSTASVAKSSVAVLPFADDRADSTEAYFGEGIADELMTALGKVPGMRVASRTSSIAIGRKRDMDVREIGRLLGVATVVEGTVRRSGGQLRVTAQLTNAADGLTLWSDSYQRDNKDVFVLQNDITQAIVAALRPELGNTSGSRVPIANQGPGTSNIEAYDLYLRGEYLLERRGAGVARSAEYFTQAIRKDPNFARAYAGLANALQFFPYFNGVPTERVEARTRLAAEQSLKLDPSLSEPRVALALAHWHALRWKEAEAEFQRAIAADPEAPVPHLQYGRMLLSAGRFDESLRQFRTAHELDPLGATATSWWAYVIGMNGDHVTAGEEGKRARELDPNLLTARTFVTYERIAAGRLDEAREILAGVHPPILGFRGQAAYSLHVVGDTARAATIRRELDALPDTTWNVHMARMYAYMPTGDTAKALSEMERSVDNREQLCHGIPFIDRSFDPVRKSARFAVVIRRLGLEGRGLTSTAGAPAGR